VTTSERDEERFAHQAYLAQEHDAGRPLLTFLTTTGRIAPTKMGFWAPSGVFLAQIGVQRPLLGCAGCRSTTRMIALATRDAIATVAAMRSIRLLRGIARQILASHVVRVSTCDLLRTLVRVGVVPLTRSRGPTHPTAQVNVWRSSNADKAMHRSSSSAPLASPVFETHERI
jgi:hypothetical protein